MYAASTSGTSLPVCCSIYIRIDYVAYQATGEVFDDHLSWLCFLFTAVVPVMHRHVHITAVVYIYILAHVKYYLLLLLVVYISIISTISLLRVLIIIMQLGSLPRAKNRLRANYVLLFFVVSCVLLLLCCYSNSQSTYDTRSTVLCWHPAPREKGGGGAGSSSDTEPLYF